MSPTPHGAGGLESADAAPATFSVIICAFTFNRWEQLCAAVDSVERQSMPALETIVVIDSNPELERRAAAQFTSAAVVANTHRSGLSGARQTGVDRARGSVLTFLDDDALADHDWLEQLHAVYADPLVLGVGGLIDPEWERPPPAWFPLEFNWVVGCSYAGLPTTRARVRNPIGANMSIRTAVVARTGAFDPRLGREQHAAGYTGTAEETEFAIRASQIFPGRYWIYEPRARVRHAVPADRLRWSYFVRRCVVEGSSKALLRDLAGPGDGLRSERAYTRSVLPRAVVRELIRGLRGQPGGFAQAGGIVAGFGLTAGSFARTRLLRTFRPSRVARARTKPRH